MAARLQRWRAWLVQASWHFLGWLGQGSARLPSLTLAAAALAWVALPAPLPQAPVSLNPPEVAYAPAEDSLEVIAQIAQVEELLARKASGLGLTLRQQLADALVREAQAQHLDPLLVVAVMQVESEFDDAATSVRGARGLMQVRPFTLAFVAQREGIKLSPEEVERDPVLSTRLAVRYLGHLQRAYRGDLDLALMAYNAGPHRLNAAMAAAETDRFAGYPRAVRRAHRLLQAQPPSDDLTMADREARSATAGE